MIEVGTKQFRTQAELQGYIQNLLSKQGICYSLRTANIDTYNFFIELFKRHPKYPDKIFGILDIFVTQNKVNPKLLELNLLKDDNTTEDISWRQCVSGKSGNPFMSALRLAIEDQILSFRMNQPKVCVLCKTSDALEYHVDHIIYFEEIVKKFLHQTSLERPILFQNHLDNRKAFRSEDLAFEMAWKDFHGSMAKLRILCRTCNLKRPKWKCISFNNETPRHP